MLLRRELIGTGLTHPEHVWEDVAEAGGRSRLPLVCSLPGKEGLANLLQKPASRLPRRLLASSNATSSASDEELFALTGVSGILELWQELFRFGEHLCNRGSAKRDDAWPPGVSFEVGRLRSGRISSVWLPWSAVFEFLHHNQRDAPSSLILSIAEATSRDLEVLARKPRMFLRRVRRKVPLGRAQQLDAACLSWLIKRPGRTAIEKAGSAQEILAVVREESFDTLENRVLKDFLRRAARACGDYLRENSSFRTSARYKCVEHFGRALGRYAQADVFEGVQSVSRISSPNYVLQHDEHYSTVWRAYQDLVRRQATLEHLFEWRFRAYRDIARLLLCSAVWSLAKESDGNGAYTGQGLWIRQKPDAGSVFEPAGWPVPVQVGEENGCWLTMIAPEQLRRSTYMGVPIREIVASLGPDLVVIATRPESRQFSLWAVWTSFGNGAGHSTGRASRALEKIAAEHSSIRGLHGVLVTGAPQQPSREVSPGVSVAIVSHNYHSWRDNELPATRRLIRELIRRDGW